MSPQVEDRPPLVRWLRRLFGSDHHPTTREQYRSIGDDIEQRAAKQFGEWGTVLKEVRRVENLSVHGERRHRRRAHDPERRA